MAKVTPVLWTQKKNKKGLSPIYLRIEANDRRRYTSLRVYIRESHWNDNTQRVRKNHSEHEAINNLIAQRIAEARKEILKLTTDRKRITPDVL
ncbi:MAG TPA: Arm DNA-binding domain-containing protein, partial [Rhodothermales bacterium]|nr:Arm DNA-binding domain-containing protein [Rhodothermales bacterium]